MDLIFTSRNGKVSDRERKHIEEKIGRLDRYDDQISSAKVEVSSEQRVNQGEIYRVQVTLVGERGVIMRAEQQGPDLYAATDSVRDVLQRQLTRYKDRHWRRGKLRRRGKEFVASDTGLETPPPEIPSEEPPRIVRVKEFAFKPMFSDEAVEQMELLGHSFFVFRDADTSHISVVYRRNDGNYGLIVPDEP